MTPPLPQPVVEAMARRDYRMHHLLWHEIRRYWMQYPKDVQDKIRQLGWEPPRPARDENEAPILNNVAGQDFLYMHRQLIQRVNTILTGLNDPDYPQVEGWLRLPGPDDPEYPVPPPWYDPGDLPVRNRYLVRIKSDVVFDKHFRYWERTFSDPGFLRGVGLGEFGAMLDFYLVDPVRRRWAAAPGATRPAVGPGDADAIATDWDDPRYDYLGDYYSMQVNPVYWRFFGWIDDRVEEWKAANGVFGTDFWTATWVGKFPAAQPTAQAELAEMAELVRTIAGSGVVSALRPEDLRHLDVVEPDARAGGGRRPEPHLVGGRGRH
jgi:hypothetical protein